MKKHLITLLKFAISFAIIGWLFYTAWQNDSFDALMKSPKQWWRLSAAFVVGFGAITISFYRWYRLVRALDLPLQLMDAMRLGFIGFLFTFLTLGVLGGDAVKAIFIARQTPSHKTEAVITVLIDRLIGLFALFLITGFAWFFVQTPANGGGEEWNVVRNVCLFSLACAGAGVIGIITLFTLPNLNHSRPFQLLHRIPAVGGIFKRGVAAALAYRKRPGELMVAVGLSLLVHAGLATCIYLISTGLSDVYPTLADHFVIVPIAMVANAVPLPGGLGGLEAAFYFLFQNLGPTGVTGGMGVIVAFAYRLITICIATVGLVIYYTHKKQVNELIEQADAEHIMEIDVDQEDQEELLECAAGIERIGTGGICLTHSQQADVAESRAVK